MHLNVNTIYCGHFMVPHSHITIHSVGEHCRILFRDDTEWREITAQESERLTNLLYSLNLACSAKYKLDIDEKTEA